MDNKEIKKLFSELANIARKLTPGQIEFIRSVKKCYIHKKSISDKQLKCLKEIRNSINVCSVTVATQ